MMSYTMLCTSLWASAGMLIRSCRQRRGSSAERPRECRSEALFFTATRAAAQCLRPLKFLEGRLARRHRAMPDTAVSARTYRKMQLSIAGGSGFPYVNRSTEFTPPQHFAENLARIHARIRAAARESGRSVDQITLVGASKGQSAAPEARPWRRDCTISGESYSRTPCRRCRRWQRSGRPPGTSSVHCRSNKTRAVAENFAWVHAIDRLRICQGSRTASLPCARVNVCVQVNSAVKAARGVAPAQLRQLLRDIAPLPG